MFQHYWFRAYAKHSLNQCSKQLSNAPQTQEKVLINLLQKNKDTLFGRKYRFADLNSIDRYRSRVPIHTYSDYLPYIEETKNTKHILTKDPVIYWARTSGSSGVPKLIPHTQTSLKLWNTGATRNYLSYVLNSNNQARIKFISFVGPSLTEHINQIPVGYISGIAAAKNPFLPFYNVIPEHLNDINDFDEKLLQTAKYAVNENITGIVGITSFSLHLLHYIKSHPKELLNLPECSGKIKSCLDKNGNVDLKKLWPDLHFMISTGVMRSEFQSKIEHLLDHVWIADFYAGTEGAYAFTYRQQDPGMTLNADLYFFEFKDNQSDKLFTLADAELNKPYELILTSANGLYRYTNEDIVELVNLNPPQIKVLGRATTMVNLAGEKLNELEISFAVNEALKRHHLVSERFLFFGWNDHKLFAHHCLIIELSKLHHKHTVEQFMKDFVAILAENRSSYQKGLHSIIKPAHFIVLKPGTFETLEKDIAEKAGLVGHSKIKTIIDLEKACSLIEPEYVLSHDLPIDIGNKMGLNRIDGRIKIYDS